jgi:DNA-binding MarR family transcriptional regulator
LKRRPDPPEQLVERLAANAATWERILGVDASALALFGRVSSMTHGWAALQREALNGFGINYAELSVLGMLRTSEPDCRRSPTELRALIGQSSAGTTRILDKLENDGHLRREDLEGDRRRVDIVLTPSGAALAETAVAALLAVESAVLAPLEGQDRAAIATGLEMLIAAFAAHRK